MVHTPSKRSLKLKVELVTKDTQETHAITALLDSGATGCFIDVAVVDRLKLTTHPLACTIPIYNVDGTRNETGGVSAVVEAVLHYDRHSEQASFAVTSLGKESMILGYTWLKEHNPDIDWSTGSVKMSRCPTRCDTCKLEAKEERSEHLRIKGSVCACQSAGILPTDLPQDDTETNGPVRGTPSGPLIPLTWVPPPA